jgi:hypothetical protein
MIGSSHRGTMFQSDAIIRSPDLNCSAEPKLQRDETDTKRALTLTILRHIVSIFPIVGRTEIHAGPSVQPVSPPGSKHRCQEELQIPMASHRRA